MYNLPEGFIKVRENNRTFSADSIDFKMPLPSTKKSKSLLMIAKVLHSVMNSEFTSLNLGILAALDSRSHLNTSSVIIFRVNFDKNFDRFFEKFIKSFNKNKYQVFGNYFLSTFDSGNNFSFIKKIFKRKIDIAISNIPMCKTSLAIMGKECHLKILNPYHTAPICSYFYLSNDTIIGNVSVRIKKHNIKKNMQNSEHNIVFTQ